MATGTDAALLFPLVLYEVAVLASKLPLLELDGLAAIVALGVLPLPPVISMPYADGLGLLAPWWKINHSRHKYHISRDHQAGRLRNKRCWP